MIESRFNKRKTREITSLQKRKNSPLGGHELTGNEQYVPRKGNSGYLWYEAQPFNVLRGQLFNSLYHSVYVAFSTRSFSIANMCAVRYLWTTCVPKQETTNRIATKNHVLAKQNRSSRQSRCVETAKLHVHWST